MAAYYIQNISLLANALLKHEATIEQAKLMTLVQILWKLRDIISIVASTRKHSEATVEKIAVLGKECFALWKLVFTGEETQPYLYAVCYEVPIQLHQMLRFCNSKGIDLDTTAMNAQQSEASQQSHEAARA